MFDSIFKSAVIVIAIVLSMGAGYIFVTPNTVEASPDESEPSELVKPAHPEIISKSYNPYPFEMEVVSFIEQDSKRNITSLAVLNRRNGDICFYEYRPDPNVEDGGTWLKTAQEEFE